MPFVKFMPKKGFTLMETLVAVAIMTIVGGGLLGLSVSSQTSFGLVSSKLDLIQGTNNALNQISELLMQAGVGDFDIGPTTDTISFYHPYPENDQIKLDADGKICWGSSVENGFFVIDLQNSQLILHDFDSSGIEIMENRKVLAKHIDRIIFSYANERMGIFIVAKKTDWQGRNIQISLNTQVVLHN